MQLLTPASPTLCPPEFRGGYLSIGNFDGVHRGHQAMIRKLVERARANSRVALVVTFDPHPLALLSPYGAPPGLTTLADRTALLQAIGVDAVVVLPTTRALLQLTAEEFFQQVLVSEFAAVGLVEGPNFYFGRDRGGNVTLLRQMCQQRGMSLDVIEPILCGDQWVSSSVVRSLLLAGELDDAVQLLGHPYRLRGAVVAGAERGRQLGFPTANLERIPTVVPAVGVYAGAVELAQQQYAAAIHIGPNPTFGERQLKVEVHLLDFQGDLYGQELCVDVKSRVRGVRQFASREGLQSQIAQDLQTVRQRFAESAQG